MKRNKEYTNEQKYEQKYIVILMKCLYILHKIFYIYHDESDSLTQSLLT